MIFGNPNAVGMYTTDRTVHPGAMWGQDTPGIMPLLEDFVDAVVREGIKRKTHLAMMVPEAQLTGSFTVTKQMEGQVEVQPMEYGKIMSSTTYQAGEFTLRVGGPLTVKMSQTALDKLMDPSASARWMNKFSDAMARSLEMAALKKLCDAACTSVYTSGLPGTPAAGTRVYRDGISTTHGWYNSTLSRHVAGTDFKGGTFIQLSNVGDEYDADALYEAIGVLIMDMAKKSIDITRESGFLLMHPTIYNVLSKSEKLTHAFWSPGNDNKGKPLSLTVRGIEIRTSVFMPSVTDVGTRHPMSEAVNGYEYDIDAVAASCIMMYYRQEVLLKPTLVTQRTVVAENKEGKTASVEVWNHVGYGVDEPAYAGGIFRANYGTVMNNDGKLVFTAEAVSKLSQMQNAVGMI
jgi:hypothetical protein